MITDETDEIQVQVSPSGGKVVTLFEAEMSVAGAIHFSAAVHRDGRNVSPGSGTAQGELAPLAPSSGVQEEGSPLSLPDPRA